MDKNTYFETSTSILKIKLIYIKGKKGAWQEKQKPFEHSYYKAAGDRNISFPSLFDLLSNFFPGTN